MPTVIHAAAHAHPNSSSAELQKVLLCLGIVATLVFTSFGLAKLGELLRTRTRTSNSSEQPDTPRTIQVGMMATRYNLLYPDLYLQRSVFNVREVSTPPGLFRLKAPPPESTTGAVLYTRVASGLQHINAPRTYAMRHRRRLYRGHPGPSPLRNVINATGKPRRASLGKKSHPVGRIFQRIRSTSTPSTPLLRPANSATATPGCATVEYHCIKSPITARDLLRLADSIVGAHPDAIPVLDRVASSQTSFPWVSSSGVGTNFKFGLVRGNSAASSPLVPVALKPTSGAVNRTPAQSPWLLLKSRNANANAAPENVNALGGKARVAVEKYHAEGKENAVV
ncbi:hypothetical protein C8R43DRAFT_1243611 [Mycena crocata]|nr:hypothetical protein C8R43DRAFT_1243611 [Mycena crocata]